MSLEAALFHFISCGNIQQVARVLSSSYLNINAQNEHGQTAVHLAALYRNSCILKMLMAFGADPNIKDKDGSTAISISISNKDILDILNTKIEDVKYPDQKMSVEEMFFYTVYYKQIKRVISILINTSTLDINAQDKCGQTTVHLAVSNNDLCMLKILAAFMVDLNIKDFEGYTTLSLATLNGNLDMVQTLLGLGAKQNISNIRGDLPIHIAVESQHLTIVKELCTKDTINQKNCSGFTPLHLAVKCGNVGVVRKLLEYLHININICSNDGDTSLIMAGRNNYLEIAKLLLEYKADPNLKNHTGQMFSDFAVSQEMRCLATSMHLYVGVINKSLKRKRPMERPNDELPVFQNESDKNSPGFNFKSLEYTCRKFLDEQNTSSFPRKLAMRKHLTDISSRCESPSNISDISSIGSSFRSDSLSLLNMSSPGSNTSESSVVSRCRRFLSILNLDFSEHSPPDTFTRQSHKKAKLR